MGAAGSLNAGSRTVFFSGKGAGELAMAGKGDGITILETAAGRVLHAAQAPDLVWKAASAIFAANARGVAQVFLSPPLRSNATWYVEKFVVELFNNARLVYR